MSVESSQEELTAEELGLPPEQEPKGHLHNVIEGKWGKATLYDLESITEPEAPPAPSQARVSRLVRRTMSTAQGLEEFRASQLHINIISSEFEESDYWCLPFFQASMMATILEDAITEIRILAECNNMLRVTKTMADMNLLLALKYGVVQPEITDELSTIDPKNLGCIEYKLNKLIADRKTILDLFLMLYVDLSTDNCFVELIDLVTDTKSKDDYVANLIEEEANNRVLRRELTKQLRQQRNHDKAVVYDSDILIASLKSQIEDALLMTETKGRYVDNWQNARKEQHMLLIHQAEDATTFYYKRRSDQESRVHSEVESLTNIIIHETLESIEQLMAKYDADIEKIDLKIQIQKSDYQNKFDERREMEELHAYREAEMKEWVDFKDERARQQLYDATMHKCAIIVQAWWRGLLVRKQLGPYRPKGKGKKKK